jgi:hypothetical protein
MQEELEAALVFHYSLFTDVPAPQLLVPALTAFGSNTNNVWFQHQQPLVPALTTFGSRTNNVWLQD